MSYYYVTVIKKEINGHRKLCMGLIEASDPDDACHTYCSFWHQVDHIIKVEEATWSDSHGQWVIKRTGKFPDNWRGYDL